MAAKIPALKWFGPYIITKDTTIERLAEIKEEALSCWAYYNKGMLYKKSDYRKAYQHCKKVLEQLSK